MLGIQDKLLVVRLGEKEVEKILIMIFCGDGDLVRFGIESLSFLSFQDPLFLF